MIHSKNLFIQNNTQIIHSNNLFVQKKSKIIHSKILFIQIKSKIIHSKQIFIQVKNGLSPRATRGANDLSEKLIWVAARMSFKIFIQFCLAKLVHFCLGGATLHPLPPNCGQVLGCQYQSPYRPNGGAASPDTRLSERQEKAKNPAQLSFLWKVG